MTFRILAAGPVIIFLTWAGVILARAQTPAEAQALARTQAQALAEAQALVQAQPQTNATVTKPHWQNSISAGLTLTRGNSDTLLATLTEVSARKWARNELSFGADGAFGKTRLPSATNSTINAESIHGFVQYNRLFTPRFYGYGRVDALHDAVANIRYRVSLSPGAGYYFIKETNTDLSAEAGPGYIVERLDGLDHSYASLRAGEKFRHALNSHARVWETAEWLPEVDRFNNYILNGEIGIEADLANNKKLTLRSYLQDSFNNQPAPGREKNDAKLVTAIAYKF